MTNELSSFDEFNELVVALTTQLDFCHNSQKK
jgi:hypothetical protein